MYLIYFDESGNTGTNLRDTQQPIFVLCALAVPKDKWLQVEQDLHAGVEAIYPAPRPDNFEIHAAELMSPRGGTGETACGDGACPLSHNGPQAEQRGQAPWRRRFRSCQDGLRHEASPHFSANLALYY